MADREGDAVTLGIQVPERTALAALAALGSFLPGGARERAQPSAYVLLLSVDGTAHLQRRELVGHEFRADGLRALGRTIERRRIAPGELLLVALGEDEPRVEVLDVEGLRRRHAAAQAARGAPSS